MMTQITSLPFHMDWMHALAEQRSPLVTMFLQFWSLAGEIEGYILIIALIYAAFNKRLGIRVAVLVLLAMTANHILKTIIQNPRPFVAEGNWLQKWAVPPDNARELVAEFSTPSGHAMAAAAAYGFLALSVPDKRLKLLAVTVLILTGLSRPYLGVHFVEDIAIGWAVGLAIAWFAFRAGDQVSRTWQTLGEVQGVALICVTTAVIWAGTLIATSGQIAGQPNAFLSYLGFLAGLAIAVPLESRLVGFDLAGENWLERLTRCFLCLLCVGLALSLLDIGFAQLAGDETLAGDILRFIRYTLASVAGFFVAPLLASAAYKARREPRNTGG